MQPFLLPGLAHVATTAYRGTAAVAEAYSRIVPLHSFRSLVADRHCLHRLGALQINRISLTSCAATAHRIAIGACGDLHLVVCLEGHNRIRCLWPEPTAPDPWHSLSCWSGGALLLPVAGLIGEGAHQLAVLRFSPTAVAATAAAMTGVQGWTSAQSRLFEVFPPRSLLPGTGQARALQSLVHALDHCLGCDPLLAVRLGLDDAILRLVAAWLLPSLLQDGQRREYTTGPSPRQGRAPLNDLLDYISANLDQPLRLSDLEARSHYSRRALQYAFRQQLNCTPKQWIREQRLARALALIREPGSRSTVRDVALACGYRHLGHFSQDFRRLYGCSPGAARWRPLT